MAGARSYLGNAVGLDPPECLLDPPELPAEGLPAASTMTAPRLCPRTCPASQDPVEGFQAAWGDPPGLPLELPWDAPEGSEDPSESVPESELSGLLWGEAGCPFCQGFCRGW